MSAVLTAGEVRHGICRVCSRRRQIHRETRLCDRCLADDAERNSRVAWELEEADMAEHGIVA